MLKTAFYTRFEVLGEMCAWIIETNPNSRHNHNEFWN